MEPLASKAGEDEMEGSDMEELHAFLTANPKYLAQLLKKRKSKTSCPEAGPSKKSNGHVKSRSKDDGNKSKKR